MSPAEDKERVLRKIEGMEHDILMLHQKPDLAITIRTNQIYHDLLELKTIVKISSPDDWEEKD